MNKFKIKNLTIGDNFSPEVIAEIGINHNGLLDVAITMADEAIKAGANIIKHQTHIPKEEMTEDAKFVIPGNSNKSIYEIIEKCSLTESEEIKLKKYIESKKKIFISSPFSFAAVKRLAKMNVPAYKIGS
jgi:N-acetylneuraminate synthase